MTTALDRTRRLLNRPPTPPVPGQLDLTRSDTVTTQPETQTPAEERSVRPVIEFALTTYGYSPETVRLLIDQMIAEARAE
ncbi:hypothetical protein PV334_20085 [Streptomyces sp. ME02-7008A-1]|uniref:hypothetical protein n=1 Tax=unclassified Streptomyces TaxID=2593676 RepID=UPI0029B09BD5|nr:MULTISPECIES: hypothetical protein [unclassified Streptomyces]MDX3183549.1 hypothetical protein [Streptomyces sp. ME02-7008A-1]MDX3304001.1 hypothetical protein [Streptomyces sp. ME02-7008A]